MDFLINGFPSIKLVQAFKTLYSVKLLQIPCSCSHLLFEKCSFMAVESIEKCNFVGHKSIEKCNGRLCCTERLESISNST